MIKLSPPLANERRLDAAIAAFIAEVKAVEAIDTKFHIQDQNQMLDPIVYEIVPELESLLDYQPTDDEINAPLHA
tara:strand:- start:72 stop:296 length:225 start_codon:yes stop_codon:yes gene_type:complete